MADSSVTTIGSALIPLVNAQQQRAQAFPQEINRLQEQTRVERGSSSSSLSDDQRDRLGSRADSLGRDDDLSGLTTRARAAVQAYQTQAVDAEREQISRLMGVDEFA
jgi:hypothetical protein